MLKILLFIVIFNSFRVEWGKPCVSRKIAGADTVCVCNQTYCDDFPPLVKQKANTVLVYESGKSGKRFAESQLNFGSNTTKPLIGSKTLVITIDKSKTFQSILGFGASFTNRAVSAINTVPKLGDLIIESFYGSNGIEYSMGRVPVASSDYSSRRYTYDDFENDKNLTHFALQKEDLELRIPFMKKAEKLSGRPVKFFSAPWYASDKNSWIQTVKKDNNLKPPIGGEYYQIWANYLVKFLDAYKAHGINIWGMTPANEPTLGRLYGWIYYDTQMMKEFIVKNLGPLLHKSGYTSDKFKLMIFDDDVWRDGRLQNWTKTLFGDKESDQYVSGIAYHWYENSRLGDYPDTILDGVHNEFPNKFLLMTEACHEEGEGNGRWDFGEHYGHDIIRDLNHWTTGWVEWNMALSVNPSNACGTSVLIDADKKEALKQPSFYVLGHFSKFLAPDSLRIDHKLSGVILTEIIENIFVVTFRRPDNAIVVVVLNRGEQTIDLVVNESNKELKHSIPDRTIQTYIWWP